MAHFGRKVVEFHEKKYTMDEIVSALQKALRQGNTSAYYWANLMYIGGNWNAAFNRLKIICMEDMAATLRLPEQIGHLYDIGMSAIKGKKLSESADVPLCKMVLFEAVSYMLHCKKSRCLSNLLGVARWDLHHTMSKADSDLPHKNTAIMNVIRILRDDKPDMMLAVKTALYALLWDNCKSLWSAISAAMPEKGKKTFNQLVKFSKQNAALAVAQSIALVCALKGSSPVPFVLDAPAEPLESLEDVEKLIASLTLEVPLEALDKHTARGKLSGADVTKFFNEGALVSNEAFADPWRDENFKHYVEMEKKHGKAKSVVLTDLMREILAKKFPEEFVKNKAVKRGSADDKPKKAADAPKKAAKEKRKAEDVAHIENFDWLTKDVERVDTNPMECIHDGLYAQFPCAQKPPALLGTFKLPGDRWNGKRLFVKGPELASHALVQLGCSLLKPVLGLRTIETRVLQWNDKFYIAQPAIDVGTAGNEVREKKGIPIKIKLCAHEMNASKHFQQYLEDCKDWSTIPKEVARDYVLILIYRQLLGLTDTCNRNIFIRLNKEVYSIDETRTGRALRPQFVNVTKKFQLHLRGWFRTYQAEYKAALKKWVELIENDKTKWFKASFDLCARASAVEKAADEFA